MITRSMLLQILCALALFVGPACSKDRDEQVEFTPLDEDGSGTRAGGSGAALEPADDREVDPEPAEPARPTEYTVQSGDYLGRIATRFDCSVQELRRANGLRGDLIHPGDVLRIPTCGSDTPDPGPSLSAGTEYVIQPGDFLELVAEMGGCTVSQIMTANNLRNDVIFAGSTLTIPDCSREVTRPVPDPVDAAPIPTDPTGDGSGEASDDTDAETLQHGDPEPDEESDPDEAHDALGEDNEYVVRAGDYLGQISTRFGCSVGELMSANHLSDDLIRVGQTLIVPDDCTGEPVEIVEVSRVRTGGVDSDTMVRLMEERGFDPPREFMGLVLAIDFDASRSRVVGEQLFDYDGTSDDDDFNPASTVKLFAAIAAMRTIRELGFTGDATITFDDEYSFTLDELVTDALGPSSNIAYDFLVTFVGFDEINRDFFSSSNGFRDTGLRRPYERSTWMEMGFSSSFRTSPEIVITEGSRTHTIDEREGDYDSDCHSSACTTLRDLTECMRRLMLQEQLPTNETYDLSREELLTVRRTLRWQGRSRGEEVVDSLRQSFPGDGVNLYHKAGYSNDWYSDTVYIYDPARYPTQAWIVALAGYPGRDSLTEAAEILGELIAEGHF